MRIHPIESLFLSVVPVVRRVAIAHGVRIQRDLKLRSDAMLDRISGHITGTLVMIAKHAPGRRAHVAQLPVLLQDLALEPLVHLSGPWGTRPQILCPLRTLLR